MKNKIDIVVTWVDGSDPKWISKKNQYVKPEESLNNSVAGEKRYKDTGFFKYFFRGIEKFAPWVNKMYLVTDNQHPDWLNVNHEKIVIVDHKEIIDEQYLPIFNSSAIILNIHKIPNLSENFIFFNDDMFLISPTKDTDFFKNNLPRDMAVLGLMSPSNDDMFWRTRCNLVSKVNSLYSIKDIKKHYLKWINFKYPLKYNVRNLTLMKYGYITDFLNPHIPHSYNKKYFKKVWSTFGEDCVATMKCRFREKNNITEWLVRYCQLLDGHFYPTNLDKLGVVYDANDIGVDKIILSKKYKCICVNNDANDRNFKLIKEAFETIFPEKSNFEK